jgi:hypothetical protein
VINKDPIQQTPKNFVASERGKQLPQKLKFLKNMNVVKLLDFVNFAILPVIPYIGVIPI